MLLREIEQDVRATSGYTGKRELSSSVVESIRTVPRHEFVPDQYREDAYVNRPLPSGSGQTISPSSALCSRTPSMASSISLRNRSSPIA